MYNLGTVSVRQRDDSTLWKGDYKEIQSSDNDIRRLLMNFFKMDHMEVVPTEEITKASNESFYHASSLRIQGRINNNETQ